MARVKKTEQTTEVVAELSSVTVDEVAQDVKDEVAQADTTTDKADNVKTEQVAEAEPIKPKIVLTIINKGKKMYEPFSKQYIPHGESALEVENFEQKQHIIVNLKQLNMLYGHTLFIVK